MSIKYFPNRVFKKSAAAIDRIMAKRDVNFVRGQANVSSVALNSYVTCNNDWQVNSIMFNFSNAASRNYSASVASGVNVLANLNDTLWFHTPTTLWQKITLSPAFYIGTTLATQLQTQLNANAAYTAASITFTVAYSTITGLFTITPSTGTLKYIQTNNTQQLSWRDSTGGHLFGLTADTAFGSTVVSDTAQYGLNDEAWIISETASTVTENYNNDVHVLTMDQALHFESNTASVIISYAVGYEELV